MRGRASRRPGRRAADEDDFPTTRAIEIESNIAEQRRHVGHSFTGEVFSAEQSRNVESALWSAIRIMEEEVTFSRQLAERKRKQNMTDSADAYEAEAETLDREVAIVRDLIVTGIGARRD